jgi:hypothetical protein
LLSLPSPGLSGLVYTTCLHGGGLVNTLEHAVKPKEAACITCATVPYMYDPNRHALLEQLCVRPHIHFSAVAWLTGMLLLQLM